MDIKTSEYQAVMGRYQKIHAEVLERCTGGFKVLAIATVVMGFQAFSAAAILLSGNVTVLHSNLIYGGFVVLYTWWVINYQRQKGRIVARHAEKQLVDESFFFEVAEALHLSKDQAEEFLPSKGKQVRFSDVYLMVWQVRQRNRHALEGGA